MKEKIFEFKKILIMMLTTANIYLTNIFENFTPLLYITIVAMLADLITRIYAAARRVDEKVESKKIGQGIYKKLGLCLLILLALLVDCGLKLIADQLGINIPIKIIFTAFVLAWILIRELISNLENLQHAGIELPSFLIKTLNIARNRVDELGESILNERVVDYEAEKTDIDK